jgi:acetoacetate decarboxylase
VTGPTTIGQRGPGRIAIGTAGYKHRQLDLAQQKKRLETLNFLLTVIPHVDSTPRICELVRNYLQDIDLKGTWTGPASLELAPHALAPVAELPVLEIVEARHLLADLTLALGEVAFDYLDQPEANVR